MSALVPPRPSPAAASAADLPPMLRDHVGDDLPVIEEREGGGALGAVGEGAVGEGAVGGEGGGESDAIDAVRARLAARGLLATRPAVVVPKAPRAGEAPAPGTGEPGAGTAEEPGAGAADGHWAGCEQDGWDVELPAIPTEVEVACPQCRDVYFQPLEATRFCCPSCDRSWRWAVCGGCDQLRLAVERQESWRCGGCGAFTRAWWRTATAARDANDVLTRRRHDAVARERALVRAGVRKRRWKLIALAVWAAVAAVGVIVGVRMAEPTSSTGTRTTCVHFDRLRSQLASGSIGAAELDRELDALQAESSGADKAVADAVLDLRAAGRPGSSSFLVARTAVADACTLATGG